MLNMFTVYFNNEYILIVEMFKTALLEVKRRQAIRCTGQVLNDHGTKFSFSAFRILLHFHCETESQILVQLSLTLRMTMKSLMSYFNESVVL